MWYFVLVIASTVLTVQCACTGDYVPLATRGYCARVETTPLNFNNAADRCRDAGGYLVSIHNAFDNAIVKKLITDAFGYRNVNAFIGLSVQNEASGFVWSDGSPRDYDHWKDDIPTSTTELNCVAISSLTGKWEAGYSIFMPLPYVCEVPDNAALRNLIRKGILSKYNFKERPNFNQSSEH